MLLVAYQEQVERWPLRGRHLLADFDAGSVVVYQAYRPEIAGWAVEHQQLGGPFSYSRMSWIKPNFLWMMSRCGWGSKPGQERVLAVRIRRPVFEEMLEAAVPSTFWPGRYADHSSWKAAVAASEVRLQWDPDHDPHGKRVERRALQLGLRGETLRRYATEAVAGIEDVTPMVHEQAALLRAGGLEALSTPLERAYPVGEAAALALGIEARSPEPGT